MNAVGHTVNTLFGCHFRMMAFANGLCERMNFVEIIGRLAPGDALQMTGELGSVQVRRDESGYSLTEEPLALQGFNTPWQMLANCLYYNSWVGPQLRLVVFAGEALPRPQIAVEAVESFGQAGHRLRQFASDLIAPAPVEELPLDDPRDHGKDFGTRVEPLLGTSEVLHRRIVPALSPPGVLLDFQDWLVHLFPGSRQADVDILVPITALNESNDLDGLYLRGVLELNSVHVLGQDSVLECDEDLDILFLSSSFSWDQVERDPQHAVLSVLGKAIEISKRLEGESPDNFTAPLKPDVDDLAFFYMNRV